MSLQSLFLNDFGTPELVPEVCTKGIYTKLGTNLNVYGVHVVYLQVQATKQEITKRLLHF